MGCPVLSLGAPAGTYTSDGVCYLDTNTTNTRMCVYAYFVAGVSMLATILFSLLLVRARARLRPCRDSWGSPLRLVECLESEHNLLTARS